MDRTLVSDLEYLGALLFPELAGDRDLPLDPIEHALLGLTFGAVVGVDPRVAEANRHAGQRPPFPSRIQRDGHGGSGAERHQQQILRLGPAVSPTACNGLVGDQPMAPGGDLLRKSLHAPAYDHRAWFGFVDHGSTSCWE